MSTRGEVVTKREPQTVGALDRALSGKRRNPGLEIAYRSIMRSFVRGLVIASGTVLAGAAIAACSGGAASPSAESTRPSSAQPSSPAAPSPTPSGVTTINGLEIPGKVAAMTGNILLDEPTGTGSRTLIVRGERAPGTRSPIHVHPFSGSTCVMSGQVTLYLEGAEPKVAEAGQCYFMPSGRTMAAYSSGAETAVMYDYFTTPVGVRPFQPVEAGQEDYHPDLHTS